jgi:hypothetical protein
MSFVRPDDSRRRAMPTHLPVADWTQARPVQSSTKAFDWSCAAIGAAAIGLASFVDRFCYDRTGAVLILLMAGGLIAVLWRATARGRPADAPPLA